MVGITWQTLGKSNWALESGEEVFPSASGLAQGFFLWKPWQFLCISANTVTISTPGLKGKVKEST